ncbi:MAG: ribosome maturation factor RimM [Anaerolineae bacterium]
MELHTAWPERFKRGVRLYIGDEGARETTETEVQGFRLHKGYGLLKLSTVPDRNTAETLRGQWLFVAREDAMPLGPDEYYVHQIIGLEVWEGEEYLGQVVEVLETTPEANDVYVVRGPRGELLLPAIRSVILKVDLDAGRMEVAVPPGLR